MDEEKVNDGLKPSEIAVAAVEDQTTKKDQTVPSEIINETVNENAGIDDTVTVKPADGSIKSAINQITETLNEEPETVAPVINVHVDSPIIKESSDKVTNTSIEKDRVESTFSEKTQILPSETAIKEAEGKKQEEKDDEIKTIKTDLISSNEANSILSKSDKDSIDKEENVPSTASKLAAEDKTVKEPEIPEVKQVKSPISLVDLLSNDKPEIDETSALQKNTDDSSKNTNDSMIMVPSLMMESLIKESESATSQMIVLNENLSKTIDVLQESEKIKESADRIEKIEQLSASAFVQYLENKNLEAKTAPINPTNVLSEASRINNENTTTNNTERIADFHILLEQHQPGSDEGEATAKLGRSLTPNSINLTEETDEIRIVIPDSKLNSQLAKNMLTTSEAKQLSTVNDNLAKVKTALEEVNASQVSNNQTISNIINNSTSTVNSQSNQNRETGESKSISEVKKENDNKLEPNRNDLSEYYLHAIYDALVSSGIKIKQY